MRRHTKPVQRNSEAHFQRQIVQLAGYYDWTHIYHTHDSRGSNPGWPDLVLARPTTGEILFAELKAEKTRIRPEQRDWIQALTLCGLEAHIWRPSDFDRAHRRFARGRIKQPVLYIEEAA